MVAAKIVATFRQHVSDPYAGDHKIPKIGESGKPLLDDSNILGAPIDSGKPTGN